MWAIGHQGNGKPCCLTRMIIRQYFDDLISLFFPPTCAGCDMPLTYGEHLICTVCWFHLPYTNGHRDSCNGSARLFWGRVQLAAVASYLYFMDDSRVQRILHRYKYRGCPEIGTLMGLRYGELLIATPPFNQIDVIVPVPLHRAKLRKRGYNQSAFFARGLSQVMQKPVVIDGLVRNRAADTQTRKTRYERHENVLNTFAMNNSRGLAGRHVLLVDDVLTTGATIEACASVLLAGGVADVSAVTIAKTV
ncbi:comF family protein [Parapedobacter composti]|uniref:ComF family protein n=2 Tax=Parapedobacter composti TaxID=623281 RepID=A0A1I1FYH8_9SPHI|nr:comF family protein [Parapedobacter composti]